MTRCIEKEKVYIERNIAFRIILYRCSKDGIRLFDCAACQVQKHFWQGLMKCNSWHCQSLRRSPSWWYTQCPHTQNKYSDVRRDVTLRSNDTSIYVRVCTRNVHMRSCMFGITTRERRPAARKPGRPRVTRLTNSRAHFRVDTSSDHEDTITTQLAEGVRGMESRESLPRMWKRYDNGFFQRHGARRKGKSRHWGTSTCVR